MKLQQDTLIFLKVTANTTFASYFHDLVSDSLAVALNKGPRVIFNYMTFNFFFTNHVQLMIIESSSMVNFNI